MSSHHITPALEDARVEDLMRPGILSCAPEDDLITALDLTTAVLSGGGADAGALASSEIITVDVGEPLIRAAQLMSEHQLTHLIVVSGTRPVGVVSTLDVAACVAWGEA